MSKGNNPIDEELSVDDSDFDVVEDESLDKSEGFTANTENNDEVSDVNPEEYFGSEDVFDEEISDEDLGADSPSLPNKLSNKLKSAGKNIAVGGVVAALGVVLMLFSGLFASDSDIPKASPASINTDNNSKLIYISGKLSGQKFTDSLFLVSAEGISLERIVEMYQWVEESDELEKRWEKELIVSPSDESESGDIKNPTEIPFLSDKWAVDDVKLGIFNLSPSIESKAVSVVEIKLQDEDFNKLNEHGRNAFKLHNGKYYYSIDPEKPRIGDLRIRFVKKESGIVTILAKQQGNRLMAYKSDDAVIEKVMAGNVPLESISRNIDIGGSVFFVWIVRILSLIMIVVGVLLALGKLNKKPDEGALSPEDGFMDDDEPDFSHLEDENSEVEELLEVEESVDFSDEGITEEQIETEEEQTEEDIEEVIDEEDGNNDIEIEEFGSEPAQLDMDSDPEKSDIAAEESSDVETEEFEISLELPSEEKMASPNSLDMPSSDIKPESEAEVEIENSTEMLDEDIEGLLDIVYIVSPETAVSEEDSPEQPLESDKQSEVEEEAAKLDASEQEELSILPDTIDFVTEDDVVTEEIDESDDDASDEINIEEDTYPAPENTTSEETIDDLGSIDELLENIDMVTPDTIVQEEVSNSEQSEDKHDDTKFYLDLDNSDNESSAVETEEIEMASASTEDNLIEFELEIDEIAEEDVAENDSESEDESSAENFSDENKGSDDDNKISVEEGENKEKLEENVILPPPPPSFALAANKSEKKVPEEKNSEEKISIADIDIAEGVDAVEEENIADENVEEVIEPPSQTAVEESTSNDEGSGEVEDFSFDFGNVPEDFDPNAEMDTFASDDSDDELSEYAPDDDKTSFEILKDDGISSDSEENK